MKRRTNQLIEKYIAEIYTLIRMQLSKKDFEDAVRKRLQDLCQSIEQKNRSRIPTSPQTGQQTRYIIEEKMKKINPCISKELFEEILKNPEKCKQIVKENRETMDRINLIVMKHLCSKEFLEGLLEGLKR